MDTTSKDKISLGQCVATPGALEALREAGQSGQDFLVRHARGDWGDVCKDDARENELSIKHGFRILSAYRTRNGKRLWIITEAGRTATTILLPEEY